MPELPTNPTALRAELERIIRTRENKPGYGPNVEHAKKLLADLDKPKGK